MWLYTGRPLAVKHKASMCFHGQGRCTLPGVFFPTGLWNYELSFIHWQSSEQNCVWRIPRKQPPGINDAHSGVWWRRYNSLGCSKCLSSVSVFQWSLLQLTDILENSLLPALRQQVQEGPFLYWHDCAPVHKASYRQTWLNDFGVVELQHPVQRPEFDLTDDLQSELDVASTTGLLAQPDLTNVLLSKYIVLHFIFFQKPPVVAFLMTPTRLYI